VIRRDLVGTLRLVQSRSRSRDSYCGAVANAPGRLDVVGEALCGSTCTNVTTEPFRCGFCFNYCGQGATCSGGICRK
jgi:hypothetical protein